MQTTIFTTKILRTDLNQTVSVCGITFFNYMADIMEVLLFIVHK